MQLIKNTFRNSALVAVVATAMLVVRGGSAVAGHMITGKQVKNHSLTGVDIKNKSINAGDLTDKARASLKGNVGPAGPAGPQGPMVERFDGISSVTSSTTASPVFENVEINVPAGASKLLVTFSAECAVTDNAAYRSQYVQLLVDGMVADNQATFCANTSDYNAARWVSASTQRTVYVTPGVHTVSVNHAVSSGSANGYLDDKSLTVIAAN